MAAEHSTIKKKKNKRVLALCLIALVICAFFAAVCVIHFNAVLDNHIDALSASCILYGTDIPDRYGEIIRIGKSRDKKVDRSANIIRSPYSVETELYEMTVYVKLEKTDGEWGVISYDVLKEFDIKSGEDASFVFGGWGQTDQPYYWVSEVIVDKEAKDVGITIPKTDTDGNTITGIGEAALTIFDNVVSIDIGDEVVWTSNYAIAALPNLEKVTIGKSFSKFREGLFENCPKLKNVVISDDNPHFCYYDFALYSGECSRLERCWGKLYRIRDGIVEIASCAFMKNDEIEELLIPEGTKKIGDYAFQHCHNLKSVMIPESVEEIGKNAFFGCEKLTVYFKNESQIASIEGDWQTVDYLDGSKVNIEILP